MFLNKLIKPLCNIYNKIYRHKLQNDMKKKLVNDKFTIFSSNCTGGVISHDLGCKFYSPTINFFFMANDYVKFFSDFNHYLNCVPYKYSGDETYDCEYPIALIDDIKAFLVHYNSVDDFNTIWNRRKQRIVSDSIFFIWCDRDGFTDDMLEDYAKLPYPKVFFSHKPYPQYDFVVYLPEFKDEDCVGVLTGYSDVYGYKWYDKHFDVVSWLNGNDVKDCLR